jgi:hypothetical protein
MASTDGSEAEFHDPHRKALLQALKDALRSSPIRPTAWACLWLSDIDKLENLVAQSQASPILVTATLEGIESQARVVPTCRCCFLGLFCSIANIV